MAATLPVLNTANPGRIALPVLDCAPLLSGAVLDEPAATRLAAVLRTLADPGRLRILSLLQAQPDREACVCHLTDHLGLSQPTVSHHLRVLFETGLVDRERRGNWVYYRVVAGALDGVRDALGAGVGASVEAAADCSDSCNCS